jgi:glycosyltransferase involved in cell wall biosynthesis
VEHGAARVSDETGDLPAKGGCGASPREASSRAERSQTVSICMATYNGERYIEPQVRSILAELEEGDEIVVVDDASSDRTVELLAGIGDSRIRVVRNQRNQGVNRTFEHALSLGTKDILFLADQDDVWTPGRVTKMAQTLLRSDALLVSSNFTLMNGEGLEIPGLINGRLQGRDSRRHCANVAGILLGTRSYFGCAMAVRRSLLEMVLPFPGFIESHDLWIAIAANLVRRNVHLEDVTLKRRIHGTNASVLRRPLKEKVIGRLILALSVAVLGTRLGWKAAEERLMGAAVQAGRGSSFRAEPEDEVGARGAARDGQAPAPRFRKDV